MKIYPYHFKEITQLINVLVEYEKFASFTMVDEDMQIYIYDYDGNQLGYVTKDDEEKFCFETGA